MGNFVNSHKLTQFGLIFFLKTPLKTAIYVLLLNGQLDFLGIYKVYIYIFLKVYAPSF